MKNKEIDSSRRNFSLDSSDMGMQNVTVAEETENLVHLISSISSLVSIKKDSSTRLLADFENDRNMDPAPLKPELAT